MVIKQRKTWNRMAIGCGRSLPAVGVEAITKCNSFSVAEYSMMNHEDATVYDISFYADTQRKVLLSVAYRVMWHGICFIDEDGHDRDGGIYHGAKPKAQKREPFFEHIPGQTGSTP